MRRDLIFLLALLLITPVFAGDATDPELTDAAGDQSESEPGPGDSTVLGEDHDFSDVDLIAAWIEEVDDATFTITVETEAPILDNTNLVVRFAVQPGPTSVFNSTAAGTVVTLESAGTSMLSGPASLAVTGDRATYTVLRADAGASGGDILHDLQVSSSRSEAAACQSLCNAQTGTDSASGARNYTLARPAPVPGATLVFLNGTVNQTTENGTSETPLEAATEIEDRNASVVAHFRLTNSGSDVDRYNLSMLATELLTTAGINATFFPDNATLDPGAAQDVRVEAHLMNAALGDHGLVLHATSERGAEAVAAVALTVLDPEPEVAPEPEATNTTAPVNATVPVDTGRDPSIGKGTFLQDAAEGLGLDGPFDEHAEWVLLALFLLLLILLLFLVYLLAGARWVKVKVTPRHATVAPGQTAEFQVEVRNRRRRFNDALAYFDGDTSWKTGVLLQGDRAPRPLTSVGDEAAFSLDAKGDGPGLSGTMRVQAPVSAEDGEKDSVTLNVVPVDEEGHRRLRKAGKARVTVRAEDAAPAAPAAAPTGKPVIRMSRVTHEPTDPTPGERVMTTAVVENDGDATARLRVVLQLDGRDIEEEIVEVPPERARAVLFPWRAGSGSNKVRVQVYEA